MANRVYMNAGLFRVSKPGKNVLTSQGQDVLFDSATAKLNGIFKHGVIPYTSFSETLVSQGGNARYYQRTFNIGYDVASYPRFLFMTQDATTGIVHTHENVSDWYADGSTNESGIAANRAYLYVTATPISGAMQINVFNYCTDATAGARYSRLINIYYIVFY